jgi:hypothetical protein
LWLLDDDAKKDDAAPKQGLLEQPTLSSHPEDEVVVLFMLALN